METQPYETLPRARTVSYKSQKRTPLSPPPRWTGSAAGDGLWPSHGEGEGEKAEAWDRTAITTEAGAQTGRLGPPRVTGGGARGRGPGLSY